MLPIPTVNTTLAVEDCRQELSNDCNSRIRDDVPWTFEEHTQIVEALKNHGCEYVKGRDEYTLLKEVKKVSKQANNQAQTSFSCQPGSAENPHGYAVSESGVILPIGMAIWTNDTAAPATSYQKPFLAPLDVRNQQGIADVIPSFKAVQSDRMCLNIGFDTEFQSYVTNGLKKRRVLSLQMTVAVGEMLIRYFFVVDPRYQEVSANGGLIPLKYCLSDVLGDLKKCFFPEFPIVRREKLVYKEKKWANHDPIKVLDFSAMKEWVIPVTVVSHAGKADLPVFRRSKYDINLPKKVTEIQGGWMSTEKIQFSSSSDSRDRHYYWLIDLYIRDTMGLTPADGKSLDALGQVIDVPKIELPKDAIEHMASYALSDPVGFYEYAMNDADIVVLFCSELFRYNHSIPMTLSSAAARAMCFSIKDYLGVKTKAEYDRVYRGLELIDEGLLPTKDECLKFLRSTRYVPIRDNPDAKMISEYFEEAYTGGFNASFYLGWITEQTTDFDLKNAYPTAMATIVDLDWSKLVRDFPRNYELTLQDIPNPLIPCVAVGDFDFPDNCYCPNIPVPVKGGMKIYPKHGRNVYMSGPDMYLALRLGARVKVFRGFTCQVLVNKDGSPSQCLADAVTRLVQDRALAKKMYKDNPIVEKSLKTMVCSCYGKTAQNVSPKTRYNAKKMGRVDSEPSLVTSPYHATYTTALVRCMLIACINQLHSMGYHLFSVTTDGFITDAPEDVLKGIDAYGFTSTFQQGRYMLMQTSQSCDDTKVWEAKHYNDTFLNIGTRGNVAVNDGGVLAHNSYTTGKEKDTRADREAYIYAVLSRTGRLSCTTKVWTEFSDIVECKHDFAVTETIRQLSMNFDYKRRPLLETAVDTPVHYETTDGQVIDTVIAEYDTHPFEDAEEFLNYRKAMENEDCVKVVSDLERVKTKATVRTSGYIGKDLDRKILLSILMGYRTGLYEIPALDGLKQAEIVETVNSWGISKITLADWKNCSRAKRQSNMLPRDVVEETLRKIISMTEKELAYERDN